MESKFIEPLLAEISSFSNLSAIADFGLFGVLGFSVFRYFSTRNDRTSTDSWELLEELVRSLRENNALLTRTNHELVIQLKELSRYGS